MSAPGFGPAGWEGHSRRVGRPRSVIGKAWPGLERPRETPVGSALLASARSAVRHATARRVSVSLAPFSVLSVSCEQALRLRTVSRAGPSVAGPCSQRDANRASSFQNEAGLNRERRSNATGGSRKRSTPSIAPRTWPLASRRCSQNKGSSESAFAALSYQKGRDIRGGDGNNSRVDSQCAAPRSSIPAAKKEFW